MLPRRRVVTSLCAAVIAATTLVGLAASAAQAAAPPPRWATQFGTVGAALWPIGVSPFANGSSVEGLQHWSGNGTIGSTTVTAATAVVKLSATGSIEWVAQPADANSTGNAVAAEQDGTMSSVVVGQFNNPTTIGATPLTSAGLADAFVAKVASDGSWVWAKSFGSTGNDVASAVTTLPDGSILVTGYYTGTVAFGSTSLTSAGGRDIYVAKLDATGNWLWAVSAGGAGNEGATRISATTDGTAVISATYSGSITFGATTLTSVGISDIYVAKLTALGAWSWAASAGSTGNDGYSGGEAVALNADGSVFVTGAYAGAMTLGSLPTLARSGIGDDIFVAKLTNAGVWSWDVGIGGSATDKATSITALSDGSAAILGSYGNSSLTVGSTTLTRAGGNTGLNLIVARISGTGTWDWAASIAASGTMPLEPSTVASLSNGALLVDGEFSTNAPAQTITLGSTVLTSVGVGADNNGLLTCFSAAAADCQGVTTAPDAPTVVAASTPADGTTSTNVSFTAPNANGSAILAYDAICTSSTGGASTAGTGASSPITVANLTAGATYTCTVTATNGAGTSSASSASAAFTVPSPAATSGSATAAASPTPTTAAPSSRATLILDKISATKSGVAVTFGASGAGNAMVVGTLVTRGGSAQPNACRGAVLAKRAGTVTIACDMSKAKRRAASGGTLTLVTTFTPVGGAALSATRTVTLTKVR